MVACPWVRLIAGETTREEEVAEVEEGGATDGAASIVDLPRAGASVVEFPKMKNVFSVHWVNRKGGKVSITCRNWDRLVCLAGSAGQVSAS